LIFSIVDIETTGGHPSANAIIEIAIIKFDGQEIIDQYQQLINPGREIPYFITALTGIDNDMVADAPSFAEVASSISKFLEGSIFVAHNVNFDYSFVKHQLNLAGYEFNAEKLCTVRLARKLLPGYPSYSLGKICKQLGIENEAAHRAYGDAAATVELFKRILANDEDQFIAKSLKRNSKEQILPPNLPKSEFEKLPSATGIYYFINEKGKVVYVGKAKNIAKRVLSHFSGTKSSKQRQDFLKNIHSIDFELCGTELIALIKEAHEIKRLYPPFNRALKQFNSKFSLLSYEDQNGYLRLSIDKYRKNQASHIDFSTYSAGINKLNSLCTEFNLCPKLCFIQRNTEACINTSCNGACEKKEPTKHYNKRIQKALSSLAEELGSFAIIDHGRMPGERSVVKVGRGKLEGIAFFEESYSQTLEEAFDLLKPFETTEYIMNVIQSYTMQHPHKVKVL
jgi:DNA polymerase III subunit epsilon